MKPYVIGICGGSGSGKTTLLKKLKNTLGPQRVSVFTMDNYYLPKESQQKDKKGVVNFDLPTALDEKLLSEDLKKLISGQPIEVKEYFFNAPLIRIRRLLLSQETFLLLRGYFCFILKRLKNLWIFPLYQRRPKAPIVS